jgi:hypothetical protein
MGFGGGSDCEQAAAMAIARMIDWFFIDYLML